MRTPTRRVVTWLALLAGLLIVARVLLVGWPRENSFRVELSPDRTVRRVTIEIADLDGENWRSVQLSPPNAHVAWLKYTASLPPGDYRIQLSHDVRSVGGIDKNHVGGWTTVGTQHQIRLEGGDHRFPPPDHEAQ